MSRRTAAWTAAGCVAIGLGILRRPGWLPLALAGAGLACGLAYDLRLKGLGLGWLCFAVALPLLPASTWVAAAGTLPPHWELLLPLAALAGPTLHLANGMVDLERDAATGIPAPAVRLGRRRALVVLGTLVVTIYAIAWITLLDSGPPPTSVVAAATATTCAVAGMRMSASVDAVVRERGWQAQAIGIALLAVGWLAAAI